jgi:hypothetical protein
LIAWAVTFFTYLESHLASWSVSGLWVTEVHAKLDLMSKAYDVWANPATRTKAAHDDMEVKRTDFVKAVEPLVQNLKSLPGLTQYDYDMLQIPGPSGGHNPVLKVPKSWPLLTLVVKGQGSVEFHYNDSDTPNSTARPHGAQAAVVRMGFPGKAEPSIDDLTYAPLSMTRTPEVRLFPHMYVGQTLFAVAAWVSPTGERGSWGPMVKIVLS